MAILTRGGNHRVPHDTIRDTWPTILIISRHSDSAIINLLLDNPIRIHHDVCLTMNTKDSEKVKGLMLVSIRGPN